MELQEVDVQALARERLAPLINAIQCHAAVVTQKSLAEGFGLAVAEAMWKSKPNVASAVGGIVDQIVSCEDGFLLQDPRDLDARSANPCGTCSTSRPTRRNPARTHEHGRRRSSSETGLEQWAQLFAQLEANKR